MSRCYASDAGCDYNSKVPLAVLVFSAVAAAAQAQQPGELFSKAPPEVDAALRDRISKFYQAHVDGKFRQAEVYVAEDTKDFYYTANKPKYLGFEISKIDYSDDFTKAKATIVVQQIIMMPGFAGRPLKIPIPSYWKIDNGDWCWYVDPEALRRTPFGVRPADAEKSAQEGAGAPSLPPNVPQGPEAIKALWSKVTLDKSTLNLKPGASGEVLIRNASGGPIMLTMSRPAPPGLTVKLPAEVKSGESAPVSIEASPALSPRSAVHTIAIRVEPTNQPIRIRVRTAAQ